MEYSEKQLKEAKLLLRKIGFTDEDKIEKILKYYLNEFGTETSYTVVSYGSRSNNYKPTILKHEKETSYKCVSLLKWETELRSKYNEIELINQSPTEYIRATDFASFVFCPASYSISKTFKIEHYLNKSKIDKGSKQHEQLRLIKKKKFGFDEYYISKLNESQKKVIKKLKSCKLIFSGHDENDSFFLNHDKKFIGKPDYIFVDPKGNYFVVEEKYHYLNSTIADNTFFLDNNVRKNQNFYTSNIIQLQSYLDYIKDHDIKYGILINWCYSVKNGDLFFADFTHKVIYKGDNSQFLEEIRSKIMNFRESKSIKFKNNVNINKCLNCSVNLYCSHKTDNFDNLKIPYEIESLKLINIQLDDYDENHEEEIPIF